MRPKVSRMFCPQFVLLVSPCPSPQAVSTSVIALRSLVLFKASKCLVSRVLQDTDEDTRWKEQQSGTTQDTECRSMRNTQVVQLIHIRGGE